MMEQEEKYTGLEIAVIGMSCKFPDAENIEQFWENLKNGKESIKFYNDEELIKAGAKKEDLAKNNYVKTNGSVLKDPFCFDPSFFGYSPLEAEVMSPHSRILHETIWNAIEDSGYNPDKYKNSIGLYTGMSSSVNWETLVHLSLEKYNINPLLAIALSNKDAVATNVSFRLNLNGPSLTVQTACSTSLVAVHLACQGLLAGDCDIAVAGGATININPKTGYIYQEGMIASKDGHIRSFDKNASGTVGGEGAGVVVLKRLEDALEDRDNIHCIIRGSAINNDGNRKVGYTAPSVQGQLDVIKKALQLSETRAEDIGYIEAHGSGTELGDVIEVSALTQAFNTGSKEFCALGSVKTNIGHLDTAAGVAGLIKTVLSIKNKQIVPSLNFNTPNPKIRLEESPFYVNTELKKWNDDLLIAGVSSLGIGGTNAHILLEEAPKISSLDSLRDEQILLFSANSESALYQIVSNLRDHLNSNKDIKLGDVAYTLAVGRKELPYRYKIVCNSIENALEKIEAFLENKRYIKTGSSKSIFMFSGLGSQYIGMGKELYNTEPVFAKEFDYCSNIICQKSGIDIKDILLSESNLKDTIKEFDISQFSILTFEYSLAKLLISWDVKPDIVIGYSFGEYVAACIAGVFEMNDLIDILIARSQLLDKLSKGAMLAVPQAFTDFSESLDPKVSLAIDNGDSCVISGRLEEIEQAKRYFAGRRVITMDINSCYAMHSTLVESICNEFESILNEKRLNYPHIDFISNVTGDIIDASELVNPKYWSDQLKNTVQFASGIKNIISKGSGNLFIEIGPSHDLNLIVNRLLQGHSDNFATQLMGGNKSQTPSKEYFINKLGLIWQRGVSIDWEQFYINEKRKRITLPGYPFEKIQFSKIIDDYKEGKTENLQLSISGNGDNVNNWLYYVSWDKEKIKETKELIENGENIVIFLEDHNLLGELKKDNDSKHHKYIILGNRHNIINNITEIDYQNEENYKKLFDSLHKENFIPGRVVFISDNHRFHNQITKHNNRRFKAIVGHVYVAKYLNRYFPLNKVHWFTVSNYIFNITGNEDIIPENSLLVGIGKVIPQEYRNIEFQIIDRDQENINDLNHLLSLLNNVKDEDNKAPLVAYRNNYRWIPKYHSYVMKNTGNIELKNIKSGGTYVVVGGLGNIGKIIAEYLLELGINLALIGLTEIDYNNDKINNEERNSSYQSLKSKGSVKYYSLDISNIEKAKKVFEEIESNIGMIKGIFHAATASSEKIISTIDDFTEENFNNQLNAKVYGIQVLGELLNDRSVDFCIIFSSISSILGGLGLATYSAVNNYLDSFVFKQNKQSKTNWMTLNWDGSEKDHITSILNLILNNNLPEQLIFSINGKLEERVKTWLDFSLSNETGKNKRIYERPDLATEYEAASDEIESRILVIWEQFLGIEKIGVLDSFIDLGGDSLKAVNILSIIHRELGLRIPLKVFFDKLNIRDIAGYIKNLDKTNNIDLIPVEKKQFYEQSSLQKRIYSIYRKYPKNLSYNVVLSVLINTPINREEIESIFEQIISRHEILRTKFIVYNDQLVQKIDKNFDLNITYLEKPETDDYQSIIKSFMSPINLQEIPQMRIGLININQGKNLIIIERPHITTDAVSDQILINEFIDLYYKRELKPVKYQYKDYSEWQHKFLKFDKLNNQENYWLKNLRKPLPKLELNTDYDRGDLLSFEGDDIYYELDEDLSNQIRSILKSTDTTLFMFMLACLKVCFSKYCNQEDIIIGTTNLGRTIPNVERIMGMFVGQLALRSYPGKNKVFSDYLKEIKEICINALDNQDYPFDQLTKKLDLQGELNRNPLYDIIFTVSDNNLDDSSKIQSQDFEPVNFENKYSKTDLRYEIINTSNKVIIRNTYAISLFKKDTCLKILNYYEEVLKQVVEDLEIQLLDINLSTEYILLNNKSLTDDNFNFN